jgi:hypothetical protein
MLPTVLREEKYRLFSLTLEKPCGHLHMSHPDGKAYFRLLPTAKDAKDMAFSGLRLSYAQRLVMAFYQEIIDV